MKAQQTSLDQTPPASLLSDAQSCQEQGDLEQARALYETLLTSNPRDPELLICSGNVCMQLGNFSEAVRHYSFALEELPGHFITRKNLGMALLELGRIEEACEQFEKTILMKPDYAEAYYNLGRVLLCQKKGRCSKEPGNGNPPEFRAWASLSPVSRRVSCIEGAFLIQLLPKAGPVLYE